MSSTTDAAIAAPLLKDFAALYPKIKVEFSDLNSTELYNRFVSEVAAGGGSGDFLWSSSMDLQIKLANDGYIAEYKSPEADQLPPWAVWKNEAYGTTFEPLVFVYNKRLLKPDEVPQSHADLVKLLRSQKDRFKGKITAYDPERSGVGFMLMTQDARVDPALFDEAAKAYGAAGIKLYTSVGAMLERVSLGRAHPRLQHLRLVRRGPAEEGPVPRHRVPEGLHPRALSHRARAKGGEAPERREGVPRLPALGARAGARRARRRARLGPPGREG